MSDEVGAPTMGRDYCWPYQIEKIILKPVIGVAMRKVDQNVWEAGPCVAEVARMSRDVKSGQFYERFEDSIFQACCDA